MANRKPRTPRTPKAPATTPTTTRTPRVKASKEEKPISEKELNRLLGKLNKLLAIRIQRDQLQKQMNAMAQSLKADLDSSGTKPARKPRAKKVEQATAVKEDE